MAKEKCDICKGKMGVCTARLQKCRWVIIQPGERLNGIQEVSGSIPLISTIEALKTIGFQGFLLSCAEQQKPLRNKRTRIVPERYQNNAVTA